MLNAIKLFQQHEASALEELNEAIDELVVLQRQKAELEQAAKPLRDLIKKRMNELGLKKQSTPLGRTATLSTSTRWKADRNLARQILSPEQLTAVFVATVGHVLRVK